MPKHALINPIHSHTNDLLQSVICHPSVSCLQLQRNLHKQSFHDTLSWKKNISGPSSQIPPPPPTAGASVCPFMQKHPRVFCVIALNDDMHSTKILHGDETCSLPGNCCLHMLQIRKCTWQRKCCGEALKTQDFRRICNTAPQDCLLSSSDIPLRVSKAVLLCHLTPTTSISLNFRLQIHLNVVKMGKREKKGGMKSQPHMVTAGKLL